MSVKHKVSRMAYSQYLLSAQGNYTLTHFAEHNPEYSHDQINRYLNEDQLPPRLVWENVKGDVVQCGEGMLVFDDFVLVKVHSSEMGMVQEQWSGSVKAVVKGIGVVTCVYVNPKTRQFWIIDYRIYDPKTDHKSKLDHMREMMHNAIVHKKLLFSVCLMDSWYAALDEMVYTHKQGKTFYCPLKDNRYVCSAGETGDFCRVDTLVWSTQELRTGKLVHLKGNSDFTVKLFRIDFPTGKRGFIVTNDLTQDWSPATQNVWGWRSKIEEFHREVKQLTGIGQCQCRLSRIIRNHIACAMLVWVRLKHLACKTGRTVYQLKHGLLSDYLRRELASPAIKMHFSA